MTGTRTLHVVHLGRTEYRAAREVQLALRERRIAGEAPDTLLLTEHEPVITLGRSHPVADLRVPEAVVRSAGIGIVQTERGGDITYHGPGQLVAYGIIDLRNWGIGVVDYVDGLERATRDMLIGWGIEAAQRPGARGAWVGNRKIASIGVHVRRWVTMHGIAINVAPDFEHFALINACGMPDVEMTGIEREVGGPIDMRSVETAFVAAFAREFACSLTAGQECEVEP